MKFTATLRVITLIMNHKRNILGTRRIFIFKRIGNSLILSAEFQRVYLTELLKKILVKI